MRKRAQQGIQILDGTCPGWEHRVPENIDIADGNGCVVAHLLGVPYSHSGARALGIDDPVDAGVFVSGDQQSPAVVAEYCVLSMTFRIGRRNRLAHSAPRLYSESAPIARYEARKEEVCA
jgi:predicted alpha/beta hydrolase family esterase